MDLPKRIELIEVCPRDGFQNVHDIIPFEGKVAIIKKLAEAGFKRLEVVSFVSPKAIPQMADAKEVVAAVRDTLKAHGVRTVALVPNAQGVETAVECGIKTLIQEYGHKIDFRLALATALGCPFGEEIRTERVAEMVQFCLDLGCKEISIADTVGMSNPKRTYDLMNALTAQFGADKFVMHLHDTRGLALANTLAAMQLGVHKFETAAGGLGGCPFAPGAAGNVATEDTLNMMHEMGIETGIDNDALHEAVLLLQQYVHAPIVSHLMSLYKTKPCV